MRAEHSRLIAISLAGGLLLWPAVWNGYPIVFADTGTYLGQAIEHYTGWDRPVFYSLFMFPLHATVTAWPVVLVQALIAGYVLQLVSQVLLPGLPASLFVAGVAVMSLVTWLPWLASELMPDLFTPLLVLLLAVLVWSPDRVDRGEQWLIVTLTAFMIASQQSSLPMTLGLLCVLSFAVWTLTPRAAPAVIVASGSSHSLHPPARVPGPGWRRRALLVLLPPAIAVSGLCAVNLAAHGRFTISPFGNVFLLARVIYDGPGMAVLQRDCRVAGWRLCPYLNRFPPTSDGFLWDADSPLILAGGAKLVSRDAAAIIGAAWRLAPVWVCQAALSNAMEQARRFSSGDGLEAWPDQVTPVIGRDFPARELAAYLAARQQRSVLSVPFVLAVTHAVTGVLGVIGCVALLPFAVRRRAPCLGMLIAVLVVLPLSAAITGALSTPHDRYQSRIMWLPPFIAAVSWMSLFPALHARRVVAPKTSASIRPPPQRPA